MNKKILVLDAVERVPTGRHDIVYWRNHEVCDSSVKFSIPQLVEENADQLKSEYLELIYKLGEFKVEEKRLIDHLEIRPNFSYWWMTLLVEKCNFAKSPQIDNIIKLIAFKNLLSGRRDAHILLISSNAELARSMQLLSSSLGLEFTWQKAVKNKNNSGFFKFVYMKLPQIFQALIWLIYKLTTYWPLKGAGVEEWKNSTATTVFVSYFFNLVPESAKIGKYESRYWSVLPNLLLKNNVNSCWLHIYVKDKLLPSAKKARNLINKFNQSNSSQIHVTLHSFLSLPLVFRVVKDWTKLIKTKDLVLRCVKSESGYIWPLLEKDCKTSITGKVAMDNLLNLHLFEKAIELLQKKCTGYYLLENQGWEFGLVYAWKAENNKNSLVGLPHSTVRYWDLRYFFDPKNYKCTGTMRNCMPLPDFVGVNGSSAKQMYLYGGYPKEKVLNVEALRYLYLEDNKSDKNNTTVRGQTILVLGDYLLEDTVRQMRLLHSSAGLLNETLKFIIKPHPACPINAEDYPDLKMKVVTDPIFKLFNQSHIVYTGSLTSAAVDAYCMGKKVVTILNPTSLNLSPLKDVKGVLFVSTPDELAKVLNNTDKAKDNNEQGREYFYLDNTLPKWRKLLFDGIVLKKGKNN